MLILALLFSVNATLAAESNFLHEKAERLKTQDLDAIAQTEWILRNFPDSVRSSDKLGFSAGPTTILLPDSIRGLYFRVGIDPESPSSYLLGNVVDSFATLSSVTQVTGNDDLNGVAIDSQVLSCIYRNQIQYLGRRIGTASSMDTFSVPEGDGNVQRDLTTFWLVRLPRTLSVDTLMAEFQTIPSLQDIGFIPIIRILDDHPTDEPHPQCQWVNDYSDRQYSLYSPDSVSGGVDAYGAWDLLCSTWDTAAAPLIGICDRGYGSDPNFHPDLYGNISNLSKVRFPSSMQEIHGNHGSAVAGVCGASAYDLPRSSAGKVSGGIYTGGGVIGIFPKSNMVLADRGDGGDEYENLLNDLKYLVDTCEVDVINMSWGYFVRDPAIEAILERAFFQRGIALIAAAGNCSPATPCPHILYPASLPYVVAVSATDSTGSSAWQNFGTFVDVVAPGSWVYTIGGLTKIFNEHAMNEGYSWWSGTSISAPHVTGIAALLKTAAPTIAAGTIYDILRQSCDTVDGFTSFPNVYTGYGKINAKKAVSRVINGLHCDGIPGDVNVDCYVNWDDCLFLGEFLRGNVVLPQPANADVNADCLVDLSDYARLSSYTLTLAGTLLPGCATQEQHHTNQSVSVMPSLENAYPNPCNPSTTIAYNLPAGSSVKIVVYNLLGEIVKVLHQGFQEAGAYNVTWDGRNDSHEFVSSGVYFYQLQANDFTATRKLVLLK
ncbi:MAG: S8 family serine peptidase [bacterium]|nr:S8 family serine peptidase [bacterium]